MFCYVHSSRTINSMFNPAESSDKGKKLCLNPEPHPTIVKICGGSLSDSHSLFELETIISGVP